jgi:hypothetical protein
MLIVSFIFHFIEVSTPPNREYSSKKEIDKHNLNKKRMIMSGIAFVLMGALLKLYIFNFRIK